MSAAVTLRMVLQILAGIVMMQRFIGLPMATVFRPCVVAMGQEAVLAVVLLGVKTFVSSGPVASLVVFIMLRELAGLVFNS